MVECAWIEHNLKLTEIPDRGIKVEQNGRSYIARKQILNSRTIAIFEMCIELGFSVAIQKAITKRIICCRKEWSGLLEFGP